MTAPRLLVLCAVVFGLTVFAGAGSASVTPTPCEAPGCVSDSEQWSEEGDEFFGDPDFLEGDDVESSEDGSGDELAEEDGELLDEEESDDGERSAPARKPKAALRPKAARAHPVPEASANRPGAARPAKVKAKLKLKKKQMVEHKPKPDGRKPFRARS